MTIQLPSNGVMTITPAIASDWLEHRNTGNRHISEAIVKQYATAMTQGRWMITHQGLAFDEDGFLLDGQHRLSAVVASNVTIQVQVSTGISRDTFAIVDTGRKRQANQLIDHPHRAMIAAAARVVGYIEGVIPQDAKIHGSIAPGKVDNDLIISVHKQWPELGKWSGHVHTAFKAARILPSAHLAVIAQAARTDYATLIESWFDGIHTGAGLTADDPRLLLRNRFIQGSDVRGHGSTRMARSYQLIARAWNYYASGTPTRQLKVLIDQKPPAILGFHPHATR